MHNIIVVAFTLKGQEFSKIKTQLHWIKNYYPENTVALLHGFMPKQVVIEKGFDTDVVDTLNELFPAQISAFELGKGPLRKEMGEIATLLSATVYVIGKVDYGVAEEVQIYSAHGVPMTYLHID